MRAGRLGPTASAPRRAPRVGPKHPRSLGAKPADRFADRMAGAPGAVLEADLGPTASPAQTARLRCPTAGRGVRGTQRGPLFDTKSFFVHFETIGNLAAP